MIIRRLVIGSALEADEHRWAKPTQLICPVCRESACQQQPAYWRMADGPVPGWSHLNGDPLCQVWTADGIRPAIPTTRSATERLRSPETREVPMNHPVTLPIIRRTPRLDPARHPIQYVVPEDVECNIPRHPQLGDCIAWNIARGHLIEACHATGGRPVGLLYIDLPSVNPRGWTIQIVTTLRLPEGQHVTAIATERHVSGPDGGDRSWSIQVNGIHIPRESRGEAPSPAVVGEIVRRALTDAQSVAEPRPGSHSRPGLRYCEAAPRPPSVSTVESRAPEVGR